MIGKFLDVGVIAAVLIINAFVGYVQEIKAEKDIDALKKMSALFVKVLREGSLKRIDSENIVPGDVIALEEGDRIPADGRLIETSNLIINESSLTGESDLVNKTDQKAKSGSVTPVNMVFQGTIVTEGRGRFLVLATGATTKFGKIALFAQESSTKTPIQIKIEKLSRQIGITVLIVSALVLLIGVVTGRQLFEMIQLSISLAVSAIPEGLPIAVTIILLMGAKRMAKRKAIIRNMMAVETLGTTTVIATDKTGTLTHNKLKLIEIYNGEKYGFEYLPDGDGQVLKEGEKCSITEISKLLWVAGACNNAEYSRDDDRVIGEPTDVAILEGALSGGFKKKLYPILDEIPFSSERKYMAVVANIDKEKMLFIKGAPEKVLTKCVYFGEEKQKITPGLRAKLKEEISQMSASGLRVIAVAQKKSKGAIKSEAKSSLTLLGFLGLKDTYRPGVKEAIEKCKKAGIKIVMLTGDHLDTARSIAKKLGIIKYDSEAAIAQDVFLNEKIQADSTKGLSVFARILPEYKYKIIELYKKNGEIVAMTGDGVNDVPALRKADIGIAMGVAGTDAAKESADMVLADDNFSTIVNAVEEGRTIFENLRKTLLYLISTSSGEVFTILGSLLLGFPLPITPLQILWINLITDTSATIPLGIEPKESDHLNKPPRKPSEGIVSRLMFRRSLLVGLYMGTIALYLFKTNLYLGIDYARTITFLFLSVSQWFNAFNCRSEKRSVFMTNPFSNLWLIFGITVGLIAQLAVMYAPALEGIFGFVPVGADAWLTVSWLSLGLIVLIEIDKIFANLFRKQPVTADK